jgi:hypothetical protein
MIQYSRKEKMTFNVKSVTYFDDPGIINTDMTLEIVREKALDNNIRRILVASTFGYTIQKALKIFEGTGIQFIVVGGKKSQFPGELIQEMVEGNHEVIFHSDHDFQYPDIVWEILRRFSEGMKVCVQMTLIVSDLGLLPVGEEVIAVAGTGREDFKTGGGADTAIVIETVKSKDYFKLDLPQSKTKIIGRKIKEILCKPR